MPIGTMGTQKDKVNNHNKIIIWLPSEAGVEKQKFSLVLGNFFPTDTMIMEKAWSNPDK